MYRQGYLGLRRGNALMSFVYVPFEYDYIPRLHSRVFDIVDIIEYIFELIAE